jgi:integrase/recombinase XerD
MEGQKMSLKLTKRNGSKSWYVRGPNDAGGEVFRSLKTQDRATAEALLIKAENRFLTERVHGKIATVTFEEASRGYLSSGGERLYLIRRNKKTGEETGLLPHFGTKLLRDISQDDLDRAAMTLCRPGASRETLIRNVYTPFIAVWNYAAAASRRWAEPRQWERPRKIKGTGKRLQVIRSGTRPVTYERAWQFVSAMSPAPAMVMTALFYSGMRPIELFALDCLQVDVPGRWIVLLDSKTGEPRGVPMHEVLVPLLTALVARGGNGDTQRVFLNRHGDPYPITDDETKGQVGGAIRGARGRLRKAGVPIDDVSPYTARHTVSTQLVIAGVHPHIKDQILGHEADSMSRHYTNVPQAPLIEAIAKLPTIEEWAVVPWLVDPLNWQSRLTRWENHGRRGAPVQEAAQ